MSDTRTVLVPPERFRRWLENFARRHGDVTAAAAEGALRVTAADGSHAIAWLPFGLRYDGRPDVAAFLAEASGDQRWGVLLVRRGGFAVAALRGAEELGAKVGRRHVQGRTKAGGRSQQRFARRRGNQAREAYEAAAEHAHRLLVLEHGPLAALVTGGDRPAVEAVLADSRLAALSGVRAGPWLALPDPRRATLDLAVRDARAVRVDVLNAEADPSTP